VPFSRPAARIRKGAGGGSVVASTATGTPDKVMGECADSAISRKFAASVGKGAANATTTWVNGYLDSCTS